MGLNSAGLTALLDDGNDAIFYVAAGDGPLAGDQVSDQRALITWGAPSGGVISATNAPFSFTGTPNGDATHLLLFSASTSGTFYGSAALAGDVLFNGDGDFRIAELTVTGVDPDAPPAVPLAAYAKGTEVGVPTGTSLTASSGMGSNDGVESITITHPVTGEQNTFDVTVFRHRRWTSTPAPNPGAGGAGQAFLIDECEFAVASDNFCVDADSMTNTRDDLMHPMIIFRRCNFDGSNLTGTALVGGYFWLIDCDLRNCENGIAGAYWTVVDHSNIIATTDGLADPHADGIQISGIGQAIVWNSWLDGGHDSASANSAMRVGTEFSAVDNVQVYYSGLACSEVGLQMRGDAGAGDITGVVVVGNRIEDGMSHGYADFQETTVDEWSDNAGFPSGTVIDNPVP